jgi:hypothetical protein
MSDLQSTLKTAMAGRSMVRLTRTIEVGGADGYVMGVSDLWTLLLIIGDGVTYEGFQAFRLRDVVSLENPSPRASFYQAVLRKRGLRRSRRPRVDLTSTQSLVRSAAAHFPLITIHREKADPEICHIGRITAVSATALSLLEVNPDATWEQAATTLRIGQITRVDFGGPYEDALALVAPSASISGCHEMRASNALDRTVNHCERTTLAKAGKIVLLGVTFALLLGSCSLVPPAVIDECRSAMTLAPEVSQASIILVGEVHGTNEAPRFVGDLASSLLAERKSLTIGLEIPQNLTSVLRRYLNSNGDENARRDLFSSTHWSRDASRQDGRASRAMYELIERMRKLRHQGAQVDVAGFDLSADIRSSPEEIARIMSTRDQQLADGATRLKKPGQTLLLLAGNLHAVKYPADAPFPAKGKMASLMALPPLSIAVRHRGGEYWACVPRCGIQQGRPGYTDAGLDGRIIIERSRGYDGFAYLGPITASVPATMSRP